MFFIRSAHLAARNDRITIFFALTSVWILVIEFFFTSIEPVAVQAFLPTLQVPLPPPLRRL